MLKIQNLMTDLRRDPVGIDAEHPRFSWQINAGDTRCVLQTAFTLWLRDEDGNEVWTVRDLVTDVQNAVYDGPSLRPLTRYTWQVLCRLGEEEALSDTAFFVTGRGSIPWAARWISAPEDLCAWKGILLRRRFSVSKPVTAAYLVSTAQGWYRTCVNGRSVTEDVFAPGWTADQAHLPYHVYDLKPFLAEESDNVLALSLGKGFSHGDFFTNWGEDPDAKTPIRPAFFAEIHIRYADGSLECIPTDLSWEWAPSPVVYAHVYMGETYDARMADPLWNTADSRLEWAPVCAGPETDAVILAARTRPARVMETLTPAHLFTTPKGETVLDMGQNMVGWPSFRVTGKAGDTVRLRMFEVLDQEGNVYVENLRRAKTEVVYTLSGDPAGEEYTPSMTYFGFRYVHIQNWPEGSEPSADAFRGIVVYAPMERTGHLTTSHPLVNRLIENTLWGQKGNFVDVPTDCPQRDERLGWTGDAQVFCRTAAFNMQVDSFFSKWLEDMAFDQTPEGDIPHIVPNVFGTPYVGSSAWGDAAVICPWTIYLCYGDIDLLRRQYPSMKGWVDHIIATGKDPYRWDEGFHYGDWLSLDVENNASTGSTDPYYVAQAMYIHSADLVAKAARILGEETDADFYEKVAHKARKAYRDEYVTENGRVAVETQTALILALHFDLVRKKDRPRVLQDLLKLIEKKNYHLATGFVGTPYLCHVLSKEGFHDIAARIFLQENYPSWLYPVRMGATTVWERWDGIKPDGTFQDAGMNSFNHYAYGSVCDWIVQEVAGLDIDEEKPGYRHAVLHPHYTPGLTSASAEYDSVLGRFACGWSYEGSTMRVDVTIPAGAEATLILERCPLLSQIFENGTSVPACDDITAEPGENGSAVLTLGSGTYHFTC